MARLSAAEFQELIEELVRAEGIGKLQEKLLRSRALVSRRRLGSAETLARQLYQLTIGLDRDGLASQVVVALWEDLLRQKLDDEHLTDLVVTIAFYNGLVRLLETMQVDVEEDHLPYLEEFPLPKG